VVGHVLHLLGMIFTPFLHPHQNLEKRRIRTAPVRTPIDLEFASHAQELIRLQHEFGGSLGSPGVNTAYKEDAPAWRNAQPQADQRIRGADSGARLEYRLAPFTRSRPQVTDGLHRHGFEFEIGWQMKIVEQSLKTKGAHHYQVLPSQIGFGDGARISDVDRGSAGREEACQQVGAHQFPDACVGIVGRSVAE